MASLPRLPQAQIPLPSVAQAAPSAPTPTRTKTGRRSLTWRRGVEYRIELLRGTIVCLSERATFPRFHRLVNNPTGRKLKRKLENLEQRSQSNSVSPEPKHEDFDVGNTRTHQRKRSHTIRDPQPNANSASRLSPDVAQSQYLYQPESWTTSPPQQLRQHSLSPQPRYYSSGHSRDYLTYPPSSQYHTAHLMSTCSSAASDASMYQFATASAATTSPRTLPSMVFPEKDDLIAEPDSNAFGISFEGPSTTDPMYLQPFQGPDTHVTLPPFYRYRPN